MRASFHCLAAGMLAAAANVSLAAAPGLDDYVQGLPVTSPAGLPIVEMMVPDVIYQTVTRADLGDVRVFNADGQPVPHALCAPEQPAPPPVRTVALPVFELREMPALGQQGSRIEVQTAAGTVVKLQDAHSAATGPSVPRTHILDARSVHEPMRAVQFDWSSPDGASQAQVSIEASSDLDQWQAVVASTTLLSARLGERQIKRERIVLPQRRYEYLRVRRTDGGPPLVLNAVTAESIAVAAQQEPRWFMANALAFGDAGERLFDAARLAPVSHARLRLGQANSSVHVILQSRADDKAPWRERWRGEVYLIEAGTQRRESPPATFATTADRYWRVQRAGAAQLDLPGILELGYTPMRLRFLAQGSAPYMLAFGSRRVQPGAVAACNDLLSDVAPDDLAKLIGEGQAGAARTLRGSSALNPLPRKTPGKLVALWGVLILGVILVIAMAISLLGRVRGAPVS